jgi:hypothetical protein
VRGLVDDRASVASSAAAMLVRKVVTPEAQGDVRREELKALQYSPTHTYERVGASRIRMYSGSRAGRSIQCGEW